MGMEESTNDGWKAQLRTMGYSDEDVARATDAGETNVTSAVEWLIANPVIPGADASHQWPSLTERITTESQEGPQVVQPPNTAHHLTNRPFAHTNHTQSVAPKQEASLEPRHIPPQVNIDPVPSNHEDQLRKAMELSRKEQTEKDESDMEKALRISKQMESTADQDPELVRAIEESLKATPCINTDLDDSWQSDTLPSAEKRPRKTLDDPVGLRNIGNTCYLNSLLQVYFYLPEFRRAILSFRAPNYEGFQAVRMKEHNTIEAKSELTLDPGNAPPPLATVAMSDPTETLEGGQPSTDDSENVKADPNVDVIKKSAVQFVIELQRLFAHMALGNAICADPTGIARAMRDGEGNPISIGAQRDASEFNQLFFDLVEKGLREDVSNAKEEKNYLQAVTGPSNEEQHVSQSAESVVKSMFTAKFCQEIRRCMDEDCSSTEESQTAVTSNWETTAIIVDATAKDGRDLHSGLEDFVHTQIKYHGGENEAVSSGDAAQPQSDEQKAPGSALNPENSARKAPYTATKSIWFTRLPPVVVVYLQRGSYNRKTLRAEKVHDRYDFPSKLAFDRYLEVNRESSERAREKVRSVRKKRRHLLHVLDHYYHFPGPVGCTLEKDGCNIETISKSVQGDAAMEMLNSSEETFFYAAARVQRRLAEALEQSSTTHAVSDLSPDVVKASMEAIAKILSNDRARCRELENCLRSLPRESEAYRGLNELEYNLHAVLVHDGAPESGHYWAFVNNSRCSDSGKKWIRLSDSHVSFVSELEMLSLSAGGNGEASAYCLMYTAPSLGDENYNIAEQTNALLPHARIDELSEASRLFVNEVKAGSENTP